MICLWCGYCCIKLAVTIVDDPERGVVDDNIIYHDGTCPCKHLGGDKPGNYFCKIHHYPWFKDTPRFDYSQIERSPKNLCRMGKYIMKTDSKK